MGTDAVAILVCIGVLMVYSSSAFLASEKFGNSFHYLWRQIFTILAGLAGMVFLARTDYRKLRVFVIPLLVISGILLLLVFVPGIGVAAGSKSAVKRWIKLWPSTFQPSELVKISMVIFLSDYMSRNAHRMKDLVHGMVIPVAVMVSFQCIIIFQPDFGAVMSIGIITITLLIIGGINWKYITCVIAGAIPVIAALIWTKPYRMARITAFLDPWKDPRGSGFQLIQSFLAFGNGGITGVGIGGSKQKLYFLPEAHTDFIFSLIGEEWGLIGAVIVVLLFAYLFRKGLIVAMKAEDPFGYYLATGLTVMIGCQALINFAVATGAMPTKGLPLPFISYGGSSLLINMIAAGILINISSLVHYNTMHIKTYDSRVKR
ncbi:MAG: putative lipid II flippase FtsW [Nitrospirae bacterium]|nr:putative lipid II flippase FtsW [Nitrospirota bacterium]